MGEGGGWSYVLVREGWKEAGRVVQVLGMIENSELSRSVWASSELEGHSYHEFDKLACDHKLEDGNGLLTVHTSRKP